MATDWLRADTIVDDFNGATEREYWVARIAGTTRDPLVKFTSASSMVELVYDFKADLMHVSFSKTSCAFGDYMYSIRKGLYQVTNALKACGHPVRAPLDDADGVVQLAYDAKTKSATVKLDKLLDDWTANPLGVF